MLPVMLLTLVITSLLDPRYPCSSGIVQTLLRDGASEAWSDVITKFGKSEASSDIQGLSKRFERFKFGIFYVLIVKIRYNFTHK